DRVVNDVLREDVDPLGRIVIANLERLLNILRCHPDQGDVAEIDIGPALNAGCAIPFPAADNLVKQAASKTARIAQESFAFANRQFIDPVGLEGMLDRAAVVGAQIIEPTLTE